MADLKKMVIDLPQGGTVELEYTDLLMEAIRNAYKLDPAAEVTPDMVRAFMINELESAIRRSTDAEG